MTKIVMIFLLLVAAIQVIKPIGWPGLKKRSDAWKLVAGVIVFSFVGVIVSFMAS